MKLRRKQLVCLLAAAGLLAVYGVLTGISSHLAGLHSEQHAAERWEGTGDLPFAQLSAFLSEDAALTPESVTYIRQSVDAAMVSASLAPDSEAARLWYDAYSAKVGQMTASGTRLAPSVAEVTAVGGDFFLLHDWKLLDGSAILEDDLMEDRVILDETLAWDLFGSSDAAGMPLIVNGKRCVVAGVVQPPADYASQSAYGTLPRVYIPFRLYEKWCAETGQTAYIHCYETVLPDPVRNFARNTFSGVLGEQNLILLQNTDRFSFTNTWKQLTGLHGMLTISQNISYPHWENAARIVTFDRALLLAARLLTLVFPVLYGFWLLWKGYQLLNGFIRKKTEAYRLRYRSLIRTEDEEHCTEKEEI